MPLNAPRECIAENRPDTGMSQKGQKSGRSPGLWTNANQSERPALADVAGLSAKTSVCCLITVSSMAPTSPSRRTGILGIRLWCTTEGEGVSGSPCRGCERENLPKATCATHCIPLAKYREKLDLGIDWMPPPVEKVPPKEEAVNDLSAVPIEIRTRSCNKCKTVKSLHDFGKDQNAKDGHRPDCKVCHAAQARERYQIKKEKAVLARERYQIEKKKRAALVAEKATSPDGSGDYTLHVKGKTPRAIEIIKGVKILADKEFRSVTDQVLYMLRFTMIHHYDIEI